jgi:hypothetical protein
MARQLRIRFLCTLCICVLYPHAVSAVLLVTVALSLCTSQNVCLGISHLSRSSPRSCQLRCRPPAVGCPRGYAPGTESRFCRCILCLCSILRGTCTRMLRPFAFELHPELRRSCGAQLLVIVICISCVGAFGSLARCYTRTLCDPCEDFRTHPFYL